MAKTPSTSAAAAAALASAAAGTAAAALPPEASTTAEQLMNSAQGPARAAVAAGAGDGIQSALDRAGVVPGLRIVARPESFRRAGREFGREPVEIPASELTEDQIEALLAEPELVVVRIVIATAPEADEAAESKE